MTENTEQPKAIEPVSDLPPAEAGVSFNWQMLDKDGCAFQVTMRSAYAADWKYLMTVRAEFMDKAQAHGWTFPKRADIAPLIPAPATPAQKQVETGQGAPEPAPVPVAAPKVDGTNNKQIQELVAVKVEVTPKPDGKAELKFYGPGDKYPRLYATRAAEAWTSLLGWAASNFAAANAFVTGPDGKPIHMTIGYTLSDKMTQKGTPYKDIQYIR